MKERKTESLNYFKKSILIGTILSLFLVTISTCGVADGAFFRGVITGFGYDDESGGSLTIENRLSGQTINLLLAPHSLTLSSILVIEAAKVNKWLVEAEYDPCTYYLLNLYIYPWIVPPGFLTPIQRSFTPL